MHIAAVRPVPTAASKGNTRPALNFVATTAAVVAVIAWSNSFAQAPAIGLFLAPPVPVASLPYNIRVSSVAYGPPVAVAKVDISVNGNSVDTTIYLDHGSGWFTPAPFQTVHSGPSLSPGIYTFRYFTASKYPWTTSYGPVSDVLGATIAYVTGNANVVSAIEYYNAPRDHYFTTAYASEIAKLDAGYFSGWARTGQSFPVYLADPSTGDPPSGLSPVCRYYGLPEYGLDTHFFSASPAECAAVHEKWPAQWLLETPNAFYVYLPNMTDGSCPEGTVPV